MTKHDRPHSAVGRGWRATFAVETRARVEDVLRGKGLDWIWISDGEDSMLKEISPVLKAVHVADDSRKSFFNQLFAVWEVRVMNTLNLMVESRLQIVFHCS